MVKDDIAQLFKSERQSFDAWQDLEQSEPTVVEKKSRKSKEAEDENFPRGINYSASDYDLYEAFTRDLSNADWDANYAEAKAFFEECGHFPTQKEKYYIWKWAYSWWVNTYLQNQTKYKEKACKLTDIGFKYVNIDERFKIPFMKNYEKAKVFFDEHGRFPTEKDDKILHGRFISWWNRVYKKNIVKYENQAQMLRKIGFNNRTDNWWKKYYKAKEFYEKNGHFPDLKEDKTLYNWARAWWLNGGPKREPDKAKLLINIGFEYSSILNRKEKRNIDWWDKYNQAELKYKKTNTFPKEYKSWAASWLCKNKKHPEYELRLNKLKDIGYGTGKFG